MCALAGYNKHFKANLSHNGCFEHNSYSDMDNIRFIHPYE